ncbi:energy transducer TonB [uncultured Psychroserpens sp.]|uniref:energy transducer TonB n=1 Tax=uncultured Psychroserpens sp. TaxID=255436 RepID=UPI002606CDD8|nr:energy transducer TonB [uncultured Psychroserpens sp.]
MKFILTLSAFLIACQLSYAQPNDGPFKDYYKTGELRTEGQYVNKKRDGKWVDYYKNGQILQEYEYANGTYLLNSKSYYEDGTLRYETKKEGGNSIGIGYYETGNVKYKRQLGDGFYEEYTQDGQLKIEANYIENELSGLWKTYHPNGKIAWEVNYYKGYRNGKYRQYYDNGQLQLEGVILNDIKKGEEKRYTENGDLEWKGSYDNDNFDKTWVRYDAKGKKVEKLKFKSDNSEQPEVNLVLTKTEVPDGVLERVPIYPGCEEVYGNKARKKCMSIAISRFVSSNFNTNIAKQKNLTGRQRIYVIFKIGKDGEVFAIQTRAAHPALEEEAKRIIKLLPTFKPGYQRGKPVIVPYSLPILFQVQK